jgi:2-dehydropantoate 2-reductase
MLLIAQPAGSQFTSERCDLLAMANTCKRHRKPVVSDIHLQPGGSMQDVESVAILGAGAIGAYVASRFVDAGAFQTHLVAGGERRDRLQRDGLVVNEKPYFIGVLDPDSTPSPVDLIVVALKDHHLPAAAHDLRHLVADDTTIISAMNGLDSEEYLASIYGLDKLLYSIFIGIDAVRQGNRVTYTTPGRVIFGRADNTRLSERVRRIQAAFDRAGIIHETPVDMMRMLWWKFMVNVGMNPTSALLHAPYGVFQSLPDAQALMEAAMREVIALAEAAGVDLAVRDIADWYAFLNTLSPGGKTSMLQDVEAGRKTEVEIFCGKVVALGGTYRIATPVNQTLLRAVRVLEQVPAGGTRWQTRSD